MSKLVRDSRRCASRSLLVVAQLEQPLRQLGPNAAHRALDRRPARHEVLGRIDRRPLERRDPSPVKRIDLADPLDLVAPQLDADPLLLVRRKNLDRVAANAKRSALECNVVSAILDLHERTQDVVARNLLALNQRDHLLAILDRVAEAVDRRDRGDDDRRRRAP